MLDAFEQKVFEQKIKVTLDQSLNTLDAATRQQLVNSRRLALNQPHQSKWLSISYLMPAGALAFCLMLGVFFVVNPGALNAPNSLQQLAVKDHQGAEQVAMLDVLTNAEELEVMSDPAFLIWAEEESVKEKLNKVDKNAV